MKRWAIARMGDYEGDGAIVPKFNLYPCNSRIWSKQGFNWCFAQIAASDITGLQADPDIYILPDGAMDMSVGSIPAGVRTTMRTRLENAGFSFNDVKTSWTVRQLLVYLVKQIQPLIRTVEQGDVPDIEAQ